MSKRILFLTNDFPPLLGGAGNLQYNVVTHFTAPVLVVVLGMHDADGFDARQPFRIARYHLAAGKLWLPKVRGLVRMVANFGHLLPHVLKFRPTAIHIGYPNDDQLRFAFWVRRLLGIPYMVYVYGDDVFWVSREGLHYLRLANKVYTISRYTRELLRSRAVPEDTILLAVPSIDDSILHRSHDSGAPGSSIRSELGGEGKFMLLTVSRLVAMKGHDNVLRALASLGERLRHWVYVIVGEGPYKETLQEMARGLGLERHVHFLGALSRQDVVRIYDECDLFIMPNRQVGKHVEGFGLVFLEANAAGKPVIGGRSGGAVDAIEDGKTGLLVEPEDVEDIARAILRLYEDPALRLQMGRYGRQRVEAMPRWAEIAHRLETAL